MYERDENNPNIIYKIDENKITYDLNYLKQKLSDFKKENDDIFSIREQIECLPKELQPYVVKPEPHCTINLENLIEELEAI